MLECQCAKAAWQCNTSFICGHRSKSTATDLAAAMGIALLTEEEYLALQKLGEFDTKTSSWIATPAAFANPAARKVLVASWLCDQSPSKPKPDLDIQRSTTREQQRV